MPDTPLGLPYPEPSGHTRLWEHLQDLAESADTLIDERVIGDAGVSMQYGVITVPGDTGEYDLTYDRPFGAPPVIVVTSTSREQFLYTGERTANGCKVKHGSTANVTACWIAIGPVA